MDSIRGGGLRKVWRDNADLGKRLCCVLGGVHVGSLGALVVELEGCNLLSKFRALGLEELHGFQHLSKCKVLIEMVCKTRGKSISF